MPQRIGQPSPLMFHMSMAAVAMQQAIQAAPASSDPRFPWVSRPSKTEQRLMAKMNHLRLMARALSRLSDFEAGIRAWQHHPYIRPQPQYPAIWRDGNSVLLDCGDQGADGPPVLLIPSLINQPYILDLLPGRSLVEAIRQAGFHPYLLAWGTPDANSTGFDLSDYAEKRLLPALPHIQARHSDPISLVGYCMGGTIAAGLAARMPDRFAALSMIGAPWDFSRSIWITHALSGMIQQQKAADLSQQLMLMTEFFGMIPVDFFQLLFAALDPMLAFRKFRNFAHTDPNSDKAELFVAVEDWLADGVCVAGPVAQEVLVGWHEHNITARGNWRFLGGTVRPHLIETPTLAFCASSDRIAPPSCSEALPESIKGATIRRPKSGHVGMVIGRNAKTSLYDPLTNFLQYQYG